MPSHAEPSASGSHLGAIAVEQDELRSAGEKARPSRFIDLDVGVAVTQNGAVRRAKGCEGEAVRSSSGRHPECPHLGSEQIGKCAVQPRAPFVAVICSVDAVRFGDRFQYFWVRRSGVVGEEAHVPPNGGDAAQRQCEEMVLPVRIELTTSALPRMRSTTELRQHFVRKRRAYGGGPHARQPDLPGRDARAMWLR